MIFLYTSGYCKEPHPPANGAMLCVVAGKEGPNQAQYCQPMCAQVTAVLLLCYHPGLSIKRMLRLLNNSGYHKINHHKSLNNKRFIKFHNLKFIC